MIINRLSKKLNEEDYKSIVDRITFIDKKLNCYKLTSIENNGKTIYLKNIANNSLNRFVFDGLINKYVSNNGNQQYAYNIILFSIDSEPTQKGNGTKSIRYYSKTYLVSDRFGLVFSSSPEEKNIFVKKNEDVTYDIDIISSYSTMFKDKGLCFNSIIGTRKNSDNIIMNKLKKLNQRLSIV